MPDQPDLRTQITDVLQTFPSLCALGEPYVQSVADALVSELLTAEWALTSGGGRQKVMSERSAKDKAQRWPESFGVASRYVTKWADHA